MTKFVIAANSKKTKSNECIERIYRQVLDAGGECQYIWLDSWEEISKDALQYLETKAEVIIVVGGDGTLIRAARWLQQYQLPFIGVNVGNVGYLCEIDEHNLTESIDRILKGDYYLDSRMQLSGQFTNGVVQTALNEVTIYRGGNLRVIALKLYVDGQLLNTYEGDGIIISTPTGSTGYSMSCGGPIVDPSANMFVVTPIASHSITSRSIVLEESVTIVIEPMNRREGEQEDIKISFDGVMTEDFLEPITIYRAKKPLIFLKLKKTSFLNILRQKLQDDI